MTKAQAAKFAGVGTRTIDREAAAGRLRLTRIRGAVRVRTDHLLAWLDVCAGLGGEMSDVG